MFGMHERRALRKEFQKGLDALRAELLGDKRHRPACEEVNLSLAPPKVGDTVPEHQAVIFHQPLDSDAAVVAVADDGVVIWTGSCKEFSALARAGARDVLAGEG